MMQIKDDAFFKISFGDEKFDDQMVHGPKSMCTTVNLFPIERQKNVTPFYNA